MGKREENRLKDIRGGFWSKNTQLGSFVGGCKRIFAAHVPASPFAAAVVGTS